MNKNDCISSVGENSNLWAQAQAAAPRVNIHHHGYACLGDLQNWANISLSSEKIWVYTYCLTDPLDLDTPF